MSPYITQPARVPLDPLINKLIEDINDVGQLNYVITRLAHGFADAMGANYTAFNATIGALECAKLELYRRRVAAYEDLKKDINGDV